MSDDGHSAETCTYFKCGAQVATKCPFMKDEPVSTPVEAQAECKHEWRLLGPTNGRPLFYCVFCLTITDPN